jgi:hypothetical protein
LILWGGIISKIAGIFSRLGYILGSNLFVDVLILEIRNVFYFKPAKLIDFYTTVHNKGRIDTSIVAIIYKTSIWKMNM